MVILRRAFREQLKVYLDSKCISTLLTKKLLFLCKHELSHNSYIVEARKLSLVEKNKTKHEYKRQNFHQMTASTTLPLPSTGRLNAEQIPKANVFRTALTHIPDTLRPQSFTSHSQSEHNHHSKTKLLFLSDGMTWRVREQAIFIPIWYIFDKYIKYIYIIYVILIIFDRNWDTLLLVARYQNKPNPGLIYARVNLDQPSLGQCNYYCTYVTVTLDYWKGKRVPL